MIPIFPEFKKLALEDRAEIEAVTKKFPPYSDFNFTSMWIWNIENAMMVSKINDNIAVRFTDYITGEPFYSFIGDTKCNETAEALLNFSVQNGLSARLKLVPEEVVKNIDSRTLSVAEDMDNFDYVYSLVDLHTMEGSKYQQARYRAKRFLKENPLVQVRVISLDDAGTKKAVFDLIRTWEKNKVDKNILVELEHEEEALKRLFANLSELNLISMGIFFGEVLISFSIVEPAQEGYVISHFHKADNTYLGIYDFLMQEKARHLISLKIDYFNYEQDLGLPGLRRSKSSFRPVLFLKKYIVSLQS